MSINKQMIWWVWYCTQGGEHEFYETIADHCWSQTSKKSWSSVKLNWYRAMSKLLLWVVASCFKSWQNKWLWARDQLWNHGTKYPNGQRRFHQARWRRFRPEHNVNCRQESTFEDARSPPTNAKESKYKRRWGEKKNESPLGFPKTIVLDFCPALPWT